MHARPVGMPSFRGTRGPEAPRGSRGVAPTRRPGAWRGPGGPGGAGGAGGAGGFGGGAVLFPHLLADLPREGEGGRPGGHDAVLIEVGNVDLDAGVVLAADDAVGPGAVRRRCLRQSSALQIHWPRQKRPDLSLLPKGWGWDREPGGPGAPSLHRVHPRLQPRALAAATRSCGPAPRHFPRGPPPIAPGLPLSPPGCGEACARARGGGGRAAGVAEPRTPQPPPPQRPAAETRAGGRPPGGGGGRDEVRRPGGGEGRDRTAAGPVMPGGGRRGRAARGGRGTGGGGGGRGRAGGGAHHFRGM